MLSKKQIRKPTAGVLILAGSIGSLGAYFWIPHSIITVVYTLLFLLVAVAGLTIWNGATKYTYYVSFIIGIDALATAILQAFIYEDVLMLLLAVEFLLLSLVAFFSAYWLRRRLQTPTTTQAR